MKALIKFGGAYLIGWGAGRGAFYMLSQLGWPLWKIVAVVALPVGLLGILWVSFVDSVIE